MLDDKRRELWKTMAEPERPEHPPERYLAHDQDHSIEPLEYLCGGHEAAREAERARYAAQHAADAEAQAEWEALTQRRIEARSLRGQDEHCARAQMEGNNGMSANAHDPKAAGRQGRSR